MAGITSMIVQGRPEWINPHTVKSERFTCGYCGVFVGSHFGFITTGVAGIHICPSCSLPSYFSEVREQVPAPPFGNDVQHLPADVDRLYSEARDCISAGACTATALLCRKLLMNVAVAKGAAPGEQFVGYVNFIEAQHLVPPGSKLWLDHIRAKGNDATHEIPSVTRPEVEELLAFVEMLLKFVFEMPAQMTAKAAASPQSADHRRR